MSLPFVFIFHIDDRATAPFSSRIKSLIKNGSVEIILYSSN